jgi:hypothetical protein
MEPTELGCLKEEIVEEAVDNVTELEADGYVSDGDLQPPLSASLFTMTKSRDHLLAAGGDVCEDTDTR